MHRSKLLVHKCTLHALSLSREGNYLPPCEEILERISEHAAPRITIHAVAQGHALPGVMRSLNEMLEQLVAQINRADTEGDQNNLLRRLRPEALAKP